MDLMQDRILERTFFKAGSPGSPLETSVAKSGSGLTIHWTPGDTGAGRVTGYVIEARPSGVLPLGKYSVQQIIGSASVNFFTYLM